MYVPAGQFVQVSGPVRPVSSLYFPTGQSTHTWSFVAPTAVEYLPATQSWQSSGPVRTLAVTANLPAGQSEQPSSRLARFSVPRYSQRGEVAPRSLAGASGREGSGCVVSRHVAATGSRKNPWQAMSPSHFCRQTASVAGPRSCAAYTRSRSAAAGHATSHHPLAHGTRSAMRRETAGVPYLPAGQVVHCSDAS